MPQRTPQTILVLAVSCVAWTYVLPGWVAYSGDVWTDTGVLQKLSPSLQQSVTAPESGIYTVGFSTDVSANLFFLTYMGLATLLWTYNGEEQSCSLLTIVAATALIYILLDWPLWARNALSTPDSRSIYSCFNADIHFPSFLLQELRILGFAALSALVFTSTSRQVKAVIPAGTINSFIDTSTQASRQLSLWQIRSVLLAASFLPFTYLYWRNIADKGDVRYIASAIMLHTVWLVVWYGVSRRLAHEWPHWLATRATLLRELASKPRDEREAGIAIIEHAVPVSNF